MAKPKTTFIRAFEPILLNAWGSYKEQIDGNLLQNTQEAIAHIRRVYRFKGEEGAEAPSRLDFTLPKNRAGYLASFGERHAYLSYFHLKRISELSPEAIPEPNSRGELTVTLLGAGPAIEAYGLCLFYNEYAHQLQKLTLNLVERVREWQPTRELVFSRLIKDVLPKVDIYHEDIDADLKETSCLQIFAAHHDRLVKTQILFVYNVLNEIEASYAHIILRNVSYIVRQCEQPLLVLLAEPSALKAWPRVRWLRDLLLRHCTLLLDEPDAVVSFQEEPIRIAFEEDQNGLNNRLFGKQFNKNPPALETSLRRVLLACQMIPLPPFSAEHYEQLRRLSLRRDQKGRIMPSPISAEYQLPLMKSE
jgi:hypothetical protein